MFTRSKQFPCVRVFAAALLLVSSACLTQAQSNAIDAAIEGYVRDSSGGAIQSAHVIVRNNDTNIASETNTNSEGYFRFPLLQVGSYKLTAEADGFKAYTQSNIAIVAGQKIHLDVDM